MPWPPPATSPGSAACGPTSAPNPHRPGRCRRRGGPCSWPSTSTPSGPGQGSMRERRPADWATDLSGRHDLERCVEQALAGHPRLELLRTSTAAFDRLDFQLLGPGGRLVQVELKAKLQPLSEGWRRLRPDIDAADVFVLDELAVRKIVDAGRYAFLIVRDRPADRWV